MSTDGARRWARPTDGRAVSGVCGALARRFSLAARGHRALRALFVLGALGGAVLAVGAAVFDHDLFGGPAPPGLRATLIALGVGLVLLYPALALLLPDERTPRRWDFAGAFGAILFLVLVGQAVGFLLEPYWDVAKGAWQERGPSGWVTWFGDYAREVGFGARDLVLAGFFASASVFCWLQRRGIHAFLRSVHVGATLVVLTTVAVAIGVLVPQIDGFEDPDARVDLEREHADYLQFRELGYQKLPAELQDGHEQYEAFRWAEGYFLYHLLHLYGIGMPEAAPTPSIEEGLERFGRRYGIEERDNRRKSMTAMLSGQEKIREIGAFIHDNEDAFWRFFQVSTALSLNRTYKSHWFASLLALLGASVFLSAYKGWRPRLAQLPRAFAGGLAAAAFAVLLRVAGALSIPWGELALVAGVLAAAGTVLGIGVPKSSLSMQKLGFFVVHNGLVVLLLGGLVSKLFTDRGILQLDLREGPKDTYWRHFDPSKRARMPFAVRLDHFARRDWMALEVHFPEERFSSRPPRYTLWEGRTIDLDYVEPPAGEPRPDLRIRVLELADRVEIGLPHASEAPEPAQTPPTGDPGEGGEASEALAVVLVPDRPEQGEGAESTESAESGAMERRYLLPLVGATQTYRDEVYRDPDGRFRLAAVHGAAADDFFPADGGRLGMLEATVVGNDEAEPRVVSIGLGEEVSLPGGYRVRVVDATTDFRPGTGDGQRSLHALPLAEQPYGMAAVWVDVIPPGAEDGGDGSDEGRVERRLLLEAIDDVQYGRQETFFHRDVVLRLAWDDWSAPGPPRYLLCWSAEDAPTLVGEDGSRYPVELGRPLPLPGANVIPSQLLNRAVFEKNLELVEPEPSESGGDGWDPDFYARSPRGVALEVVRHPDTPQETVERAVLATTDYARSNLWFSADGRFVLRFVENTEMLPFEWRSVLSIIERDNAGEPYEVPLGDERDREIRVNDYLYYRGYRFFQTNAAPEAPTYSGIGVVYDPGIPIVLLGMYTIITGAAIAFLVRPIVQGRSREKTSAPPRRGHADAGRD